MIDISKEVTSQFCTGCSACAMRCHHSAISMRENDQGFCYPAVDKTRCNDCKVCLETCPQINTEDYSNDVCTYAAYNIDEGQRLSSSSGGIFILLSQYVIKQGGVVFGAAFDKEWNVEHSKAEDIETLNKLKKSKYVQSNTKQTYREAKDELKRGKLVLYSGTPCQIAGLKKYLGRNYANLICVDFVCHGVPSPKLWEKMLHLAYRKRKRQFLVDVDFRSKSHGWNNPYVRFVFRKGKYEYEDLYKFNEHPYTRLFDQGITLRPSCYYCYYRKIEHPADITLGDCWHWRELCHDMNDDKGLSIVMTQNVKGEQILKDISSSLKIVKINRDDVIQYTEIEKTFFIETDGVREFNKLIKVLPLSIVAKIANRRTLNQRIKSKIKRMI